VLGANVARESGATVDVATMDGFDVPLYNGDLEAERGISAGAQALRDRLLASDAFILASPEYKIFERRA
jgi:NAD(P)H-dependent FMN reductase